MKLQLKTITFVKATTPMKPYELIREAAKGEGLTQQKLANKLSKSQGTISDALNGKNPTTLNKIANLMVEEYGYERSYFFPSADERLTEIQNDIKQIKEVLKDISRKFGG